VSYQVLAEGPLDLSVHTPLRPSQPWGATGQAPETAAFFRPALSSFSRLLPVRQRGTWPVRPGPPGWPRWRTQEGCARGARTRASRGRVRCSGVAGRADEPVVRRRPYPERTTGSSPGVRVVRQTVPACRRSPRQLREQLASGLLLFCCMRSNHWGEGQAAPSLFMPSLASEAKARRMLGMFRAAPRKGPAMAPRCSRGQLEVDVRPVPPVVSGADARVFASHRRPGLGPSYWRYVADHVPRRELRRAAGEDHVPCSAKRSRLGREVRAASHRFEGHAC